MDYWEVLNRSASLPELSALTRMGSELLFLGKGTGMGLAIFRVSLSLPCLCRTCNNGPGKLLWWCEVESAERGGWSHRMVAS